MSFSEDELKLALLFKQRLEAFETFSKPMHEGFQRQYKVYRGTIFCEPNAIEREFYYDVRLVYSIVQGFVPSIIISDPDIILKPRKESSIDLTSLCEIVINYYFRELNIKQEVKQTLLDTFIYGFGVLKTGWQTKFQYAKKKDDPGQPTPPDQYQPDEYVKVDNPIMKRISPYLFMWDVQARNLESARWVGEKIIRPREEVLNNRAYDSKAIGEVKGNHVGVQDFLFSYDDGPKLMDIDPDKYIMIYEIHDRERGKLITLADGTELPLRIIDYPYDALEGTHYGMLVLHPMPDKVEGISLCDLVQDQQIALNRIRTLQIEACKRAGRLYAIDPEADIDNEQIQAIQTAEHGSIVRVPVNAIKPIDHAPLPQELFAGGDLAVQDILRTVGSPPSRIGMAAGGRTSATEINTMQSVEQYRLEDARTIVSDFIGRMCKKMFQIMANKLTDDKVIMIAGEDRFVPFKFTRDQLQGDFDFIIEPNSMTRSNRVAEAQQLIQLYNISAQLPDVNHTELLKDIMKGLGIRDTRRYFKGPITTPQMGQNVVNSQVQNQANPPDAASIIGNAGLTPPRSNQ